jgi:predicted LPLAT superfamily acyltransferase
MGDDSMNPVSVPRWLTQRERGSRFTMRLISWITLSLGYTAGRILLYPICLYFLIAFSGGARRASRDFLGRVLGRQVSVLDLFRHYHTFASTIHDRIYLLTGRLHPFDVRLEGTAILEEALRAGRGCILLGSHLGSFEILRAKGIIERKLPIRVLMHEGNAQRLNSVLHGLNPQIRNSLIPLGRPDTLLRVKEALDQGEIVGLLADRAMPGETVLPCPFLGEDAPLPEGPFLLAHLLEVPVVLFFGLYLKRGHYAVYLEPLPPSPHTTDRRQATRTLAQHYTRRLEYYAEIAPYNWFNFYDFWHPA